MESHKIWKAQKSANPAMEKNDIVLERGGAIERVGEKECSDPY